VSLLGVDVGTSAIKAVAIATATGAPLASTRQSYRAAFPEPGRMELDPELVWAAFVETVRSVADADAIRDDPVEALALSVSCDEVVPVDAAGRPLGPCIMAPDTRGADAAAEIGDLIPPSELYRRTGLALLPLYPLARMVWYRRHMPDLAALATRYFGWGELILDRLGQPAVTDATTAGRWLAWDVRERAWMRDLVADLSLPPAVLPEVVAPGTQIGTLPPVAARLLGLGGTTAVVAGAFDQICGAVGAGLREPGDAAVGTGSWENTTILADGPLGMSGLDRGATWGPYVTADRWAVLLMNAGGGSILRWFRTQFGDRGEASWAADDAGVDLDLSGAGGDPTRLLFLPHLQGSHSPWRDPDSKGALVGLTLATSRDEVVQALLEGITYELRLNLDGLAPELTIRPPVRNIGRGSRSRAWVQLKADILGIAVSTIESLEPGCLGAAILAGVGAGVYPSVAAAQSLLCRAAATIEPDPIRHQAYDSRFAAYRNLYPVLRETLGLL
jgi:xylulokinase